MKKSNIIYGVVGLAIGLLISLFCTIHHFGEDSHHHDDLIIRNNMHSQMEEMNKALEGKTGNDFDKAFIEEMIVHHQGAVKMANQASNDAGHSEIKTLAKEIVSNQTKEINQMKVWYKAWFGIEYRELKD